MAVELSIRKLKSTKFYWISLIFVLKRTSRVYYMTTEIKLSRNTNMNNNKRKRAVNFTELEVRMLIDVVLKYMHIVENKTSDAVTWKQKKNVWEDIAKAFNPLTGQVNRSATELRLKYECIKKKIKKKQSHNKYECFKTGGGVADIESFTDYEEKILNHITLSVDGLLSKDDCDGDFLEATPKTIEEKENQPKIKATEVNSTYYVSSLAVPVVCDFPSNVTVDCEYIGENVMEFDVENNSSLEKVADLDINMENMCSNNNNLESCNLENIGDLNERNKKIKEFTSSQTWSQWNSTQLKSAKHKALINKTKSKPIQRETLNTKIATVTDSRHELLVLQIEIAKNEDRRKTTEHKEKLNNLKLEGNGILAKNEYFAKEDELLQLKIANEKLKQQLLQLQLQKFLQD